MLRNADPQTWPMIRNFMLRSARDDESRKAVERMVPEQFDPTVRDAMLQRTVSQLEVYKNEAQERNAQRVDERTRSEAAANRAVTMRGQDMTNARAREANAIGGKPPPGYRFTPDGSLQAIPGGPADASTKTNKKTEQARSTLALVDEAEKLISKSTGSYAGAGIDLGARAIGMSTTGAEAAAQLQVLQASLMLNMPRMEGPQSDRDVQLYREAAGQIGDPTVPNGIKRAALKTIRTLNERYASVAQGPRVQRVDKGAAQIAAPMSPSDEDLIRKYLPQ